MTLLSPLPDFQVPDGTCDCHVHVFGPQDRYPLSTERNYMPGLATVADLTANMRALGVQRVVIVQPSPYGADNRCTVDALAALGINARGVAVVEETISDLELERLHQAGIRGIRLNIEAQQSRDAGAVAAHLEWALQRVGPLGWHVQLYADLAMLHALRKTIAQSDVPVVVDHFARASAQLGLAQPNLADLMGLVRDGRVWVKLSAPQRISDLHDHSDVAPIARAFVDAHPGQMLWGSDWPHPGAPPGVARQRHRPEPFMPVDDRLALSRLASWVGAAAMQLILVDNPARLYGLTGDQAT